MIQYLYISGPITGVEDYFENFLRCQEYIKEYTLYIPINPVILNAKLLEKEIIKNPTHLDYMRSFIHFLTEHPFNTSIVFLPGYHKSISSLGEQAIASKLKYEKMWFHPSIPVINGIPKEMLKNAQ